MFALLLALAQQPAYATMPAAEPPYYRVRYDASSAAGELPYPVNYTVWVPPGIATLRGVIVHQHGCGEGSCKSGLTGAFDLHWQALARKHGCALLSPAYEQPEKADCQQWCDPRNGSDATFRRALADLGAKAGRPELARVPWALWGHSGGGHWAGGMVFLHPDRVAAAWLRSGVPMLATDPKRLTIKPYDVPAATLGVPLLCNLGTKEGVTVTTGQFAGVWPANRAFAQALREKGGLVGIAIDPLTGHECGNQRYLAIPWLDACLTARLPDKPGDPLRPMPAGVATEPAEFGWLPTAEVAKRWTEYVRDTRVADPTLPPAPSAVRLTDGVLTWDCQADPESGLAGFVITRDGSELATLPEKPRNPFGRPLFQGLQYSDTPNQPLAVMRYAVPAAEPGKRPVYAVAAMNTVGGRSPAVSAE